MTPEERLDIARKNATHDQLLAALAEKLDNAEECARLFVLLELATALGFGSAGFFRAVAEMDAPIRTLAAQAMQVGLSAACSSVCNRAMDA